MLCRDPTLYGARGAAWGAAGSAARYLQARRRRLSDAHRPLTPRAPGGRALALPGTKRRTRRNPMEANYTLAGYIIYLLISIALTVWVARTLFTNGRCAAAPCCGPFRRRSRRKRSSLRG